jgi:hypothetical protein
VLLVVLLEIIHPLPCIPRVYSDTVNMKSLPMFVSSELEVEESFK